MRIIAFYVTKGAIRYKGAFVKVMMAGGVAKNIAVVKALERNIEVPIEVSKYTQGNGAICAALMAAGFEKNTRN